MAVGRNTDAKLQFDERANHVGARERLPCSRRDLDGQHTAVQISSDANRELDRRFAGLSFEEAATKGGRGSKEQAFATAETAEAARKHLICKIHNRVLLAIGTEKREGK